MLSQHDELSGRLQLSPWSLTASLPAPRILIVDDDEPIRRALLRVLSDAGYEGEVAGDVAEAKMHMLHRPFDLMLCDVVMPGANGLTLLEWAHNEYPDMAVIMVTGYDNPSVVEPMARNGAYGYVSKPYSTSTILVNVASALQHRNESLAERDHADAVRRELDEHFAVVSAAVKELRSTARALHAAQEEAVDRLALAAAWRQASANSHMRQISEHTAKMAHLLHMDPEDVEIFRLASKLHDIGELALPDRILTSPGPLDPEDRALVARHPEIGAEMLRGSDSPLMQTASVMALTHHERWDGTGYPRGLAGTNIPIAGRIVAIADSFEALCHGRPYRPGHPVEEAVEIMRASRGSHFDPEVLDLFLERVVARELQVEAT